MAEAKHLADGHRCPSLLLDIHGQGEQKTTIFRGTLKGQTVKNLVSAFGNEALIGAHSILGYLEAMYSYRVCPSCADTSTLENEEQFFGGYTVQVLTYSLSVLYSIYFQAHGSHNTDGIDAIQLELGTDLRCQSKQSISLASRLAEASMHFFYHYGVTG